MTAITMKKTLRTSLFCLVFFASFFANAQCSISPFIQQNYEFDAKLLVLREIQNNVNDPDYDNPFISQARIDYHLEKFSAMYENPNNSTSIDSLFNEFQFHVNTEYNQFQVSFKEIGFSVFTTVSWVQTLIDTGTSGYAPLDNFMSQYQFTYVQHFSSNNSGKTFFSLQTSNEVLNMNALIDDLENIPAIETAYGLSDTNIANRFNYTGVLYFIVQFPIIAFQTELCDIIFDENQNYQFMLGGGDCFSGCGLTESRYVSISDDCSQVTFSRTLSTEETELTNFALYPNPTSDILNIQGIENIQQLEIYSVLGSKIQIPLDASSNTLNVSSLKNGVYFLKVTDDQNRSAIRKFIKK